MFPLIHFSDTVRLNLQEEVNENFPRGPVYESIQALHCVLRTLSHMGAAFPPPTTQMSDSIIWGHISSPNGGISLERSPQFCYKSAFTELLVKK